MNDEVITLIIASVNLIIILAIIFEARINVITNLFKRLKPLTPLQKEIREEERTIKELEAQKADMERLAALKRKREALFEEPGESDFKTRTGPHFHWCPLCGNYYAGDECACRKNAGDVIDPLEFFLKKDFKTPSSHALEFRKCPECGVEAYDWLCHNCRNKKLRRHTNDIRTGNQAAQPNHRAQKYRVTPSHRADRGAARRL